MHDPTCENNQTVNPTRDDTETRNHILIVAARVFAERGYKDASVEQVCSESGIDTGTFSTHFADKYDLFKAVVLRTSREMLRASDGMETRDPHQAKAVLGRIIDSTTAVAISTRSTGGFYRSEYRYLQPEDSDELSGLIRTLRLRVQEPLMLHRPRLSYADASMLCTAALSIIASITVHATDLPAPKVHTLLTVTARRLLDSDPASGDELVGAPATRPSWHGDTSESGRLLAAAVDRCFADGYRGTTLDQVAESAGIDPARARTLFPTLSDLLTSGCLSAYESLDDDMQRAIAAAHTPRDTLLGLCRAYVRHYVLDYKLMTIYLADARNFDNANRDIMLELQGRTINMWTQAIQNARPELSQTEATYLVFAAMSLVSDLARVSRWQNDPATTNKIEKCAGMVMALIR